MQGVILCVTADDATARAVKTACHGLGVAHVVVPDVAGAEIFFDRGSADLAVCDYAAFEAFRRVRPGLYALLVVDPGQSEQTILAMRHGALDCLTRPLLAEDLQPRLAAALEVVRTTVATPRAASAGGGPAGVRMVGQSPAMQELYKRIGLVAPQRVNVLITGESGTGKELVARAIHEHSPREGKPFLAINCAAIPEGLLESELFGHEKGAFTGADRQRIGTFEAADGGTLFFDEIGDMPAATQAKLLRVLQEQAFQRVGGNETISCDVRIVAATHQPLDDLVAQKRFRADLHYRLNVASIHVPPLREREVDTVLLAHDIVNRSRDEFGTQIVAFAPETVRALLLYGWPGNVRELENVIKSALTVARGSVLQLEHLPETVRAIREDEGAAAAPGGDELLARFAAGVARGGAAGSVYADAVRALDRALIAAALERCDGSVSAAARLLGISRTTLRKKLAEGSV